MQLSALRVQLYMNKYDRVQAIESNISLNVIRAPLSAVILLFISLFLPANTQYIITLRSHLYPAGCRYSTAARMRLVQFDADLTFATLS